MKITYHNERCAFRAKLFQMYVIAEPFDIYGI